MAQKVRIARLDATAAQPPFLSGRPLWEEYAAINSFIRRHLPAASATLIAEPSRPAGSSFIDWYTDAAGRPVAITALGRADREKAESLLADRLQALRDLAARHSGDPAAALLAAAIVDPPTESVYVVNGQPVIIGWGRPGNGVPARSIAASAPAPVAEPAAMPATPVPAAPVAAATVAAAPVVAARSGLPWGCLASLLALALILALLWWLWPLLWGSLGLKGDDRLAALTAEEAALKDEIAAAEEELRRRLAACAPEKPVIPPKEESPPPVVPEKEIPVQPIKPEPTPVPETKPQPKPDVPPAPKKAATEPPPAKVNPPQPSPKQQAKADSPPDCPPPRKKWEAPELVVLLDASGSMRLKAGVSQEEITALTRRARAGDRQAMADLAALQGAGGNDRLSAAKAAVGRLVSTLPTDMDVGLVVFGKCEGADNHKFFSPSERPRLAALLESIRPQQGTPLARGLERAGNTVDGVSVPATLVVVTDGEDSCGGDPCAAARALKAAKPKLTINVVDVNGMGEGRCMADATGGRVLPMRSAAELPELIRKASGETPVPPGCGG